MGVINKRPLRAFVRYDGKNRIVGGSLIFRKGMPKVGKWAEIPAYRCCVPSDPNCIEYSIVVGDETISLWYTGCDGEILGPLEMNGPLQDTFCARRGTVAVTGSPVVTEVGLCEDSATTTTTTSSIPLCVTYAISVERGGATLSYIDCENTIVNLEYLEPIETSVCAILGTLILIGNASAVLYSYSCEEGENN